MKLPDDLQIFDPTGAFRNYERNLPHWRQQGASYFLTFRLNDSLPQTVADEMRVERDAWRQRIEHELVQHEGKLSPSTDEEYEAFQLRSARRLERLMDERHGECVLKQPLLREIVASALFHFQGQRYAMHGFVVMPNHVHLAVKPMAQWQPEELLHTWKRFTARTINQHLGREGQLWQHDSWNRIIRDEEHWQRVMRYIQLNPIRAKLWSDQSTVWIDPRLWEEDSMTREESSTEPW